MSARPEFLSRLAITAHVDPGLAPGLISARRFAAHLEAGRNTYREGFEAKPYGSEPKPCGVASKTSGLL